VGGPGERVRVVPLTAANLGRIHRLTAESVFWEVDPLGERYFDTVSELDKSVWLERRAREQAVAGFSIAEGHSSVGAFATVLFCPAAEAPGAVRMPTAPASRDAWLITSMHLDSTAQHRGWEAVLLDSVIMAATGAGANALEVFGLRPEGDARTGLSASVLRNAARIGLVDAAILESAGFQVREDHPVVPRLRLPLPPDRDLLSAREVEDLLAWAPAS